MPQPTPSEHKFLAELDKKLWTAACKLLPSLDAAVYKHAVLGLIFLKYVSDSFTLRREELEALFRNPASDYHLDRANYKSDAAYEAAIRAELEDRDYFTEKNIFWVPPLARWENIRSNVTLAPDTEIEIRNGKSEKYIFRSAARLVDDALEAIEKENPRLKGIIEKNRYMQLELEPSKLIDLINTIISAIPFSTSQAMPGGALTPCPSPKGRGEMEQQPRQPANLPSPPGRRVGDEGMPRNARRGAVDILGHVYEYFLGQFALAEGKKGGQYYTPKSIVSVIVDMLEPFSGKVYDPAMGSGGFFVQSQAFIEAHGGRLGQISIYGQESNPTTWRLAAMNMAIRGLDFNFGKEPADSFLNDQHPDLRADYVMANPPFNISEWWDGKLEGDPRWVYGTPPKGNANFAWLQHMLHHLAPTGSMALLLANGSMSSNTKGEGDIRKAIIEADLVECILALPGQLFTNTQIPACVWFLTKSKRACSPSPRSPLPEGEGQENGQDSSPSGRGQGEGAEGVRDRSGEVLFIDARQLGYMKTRVMRDFTAADLEKISGTFHAWRHAAAAPRRPHPASGHPLPEGEGQENTTAHPPSTSGRGDGGEGAEGIGEGAEGVGNGKVYQDILGFCKSATLAEIASHGYVLTPGRYVGAPETEDDGEPFEEKMQRLVAELNTQFTESAKLENAIKANLQGLGFSFDKEAP